jgi:hypothetical protein
MDLLKPIVTDDVTDDDGDIFTLTIPKLSGDAELRKSGGDFILLKDSIIKKEWGNQNQTDGYRPLHNEITSSNKVEEYRDGLVRLKEDVVFASTSGAASVVLGRQASGTTEWRTAKESYKEWLEAKLIKPAL